MILSEKFDLKISVNSSAYRNYPHQFLRPSGAPTCTMRDRVASSPLKESAIHHCYRKSMMSSATTLEIWQGGCPFLRLSHTDAVWQYFLFVLQTPNGLISWQQRAKCCWDLTSLFSTCWGLGRNHISDRELRFAHGPRSSFSSQRGLDINSTIWVFLHKWCCPLFSAMLFWIHLRLNNIWSFKNVWIFNSIWSFRSI